MNAVRLAALVTFATSLPRATAAPPFPLVLAGEACDPGGACPFAVEWTLQVDGTWTDAGGREGTWRHRPGRLLLTYDGGSPTYWGDLAGGCVDGDFGPQVGQPRGRWRACVVP